MLSDRATLTGSAGSRWRERSRRRLLLGERFAAAGFRVALPRTALASFSARRTVREFCARHVRWTKCAAALAGIYLLSLKSRCPSCLRAGAGLCWRGFERRGWLVAVPAVWHRARFGLTPSSLAGCEAWRLSPTTTRRRGKDLLCIGIWMAGIQAHRRLARHVLRIGPGSRLFPLEQPQAHGRHGEA